MKLVTGTQMKALDALAIQELGLSSPVLMENAGRGVAQVLQRDIPALAGKTVVIACGKGNNGGDGLVVARTLDEAGVAVEAFLLDRPARCSEETRAQLAILERAELAVTPLVEGGALARLEAALARAEVVVDALLGIGLEGPARGRCAQVIRLLNAGRATRVALDVPSGLEADRGRVEGPCVRAALTVTLGLPKTGLLLYPGREFVGRLEVVPLGYPSSWLANFPSGLTWLEAEFVAESLPPRPATGHKGTFGHALILAGSRGMSGAALLAAQAALRGGAGLVHLAYPEPLDGIISSVVLAAVKHPLPAAGGALAEGALAALEPLLPQLDAVALGPGLSRLPQVTQLVRSLVPLVEAPLVLDADGLNALVGHLELLRGRRSPPVLTPHPGEFARLSGLSVEEVEADRLEVARRFAREWGVVLALKGVPTVVATPEGHAYLNSTGNTGLAKGGSGDVLTGIIVSLLAQGVPAPQAAACGVWLHGRAADALRPSKGERGALPQDLIEALPAAFPRG